MIAKGTAHNNGAKLARYLITGKRGERAQLWQLRGFAEANAVEAFRTVQAMAQATQCAQPFFHVQVRNRDGEELTRAQWERAADRIEAKLGYSGQARAIAFHLDLASGHEHMHVAWSRIDEATMTALPLPFFKLRLKEVSRELERELCLPPVENARPRAVMAPARGEEDQARRLDVDLHAVRDLIRACYDRADGGKAFACALAAHGLTLARGAQRDFVVIDAEGGLHALGKRVLGTSAAETRERLSDLDRASLPTVEQARENLASAHLLEPAPIAHKRVRDNTRSQIARLLHALEPLRIDVAEQRRREQLRAQDEAYQRAAHDQQQREEQDLGLRR